MQVNEIVKNMLKIKVKKKPKEKQLIFQNGYRPFKENIYLNNFYQSATYCSSLLRNSFDKKNIAGILQHQNFTISVEVTTIIKWWIDFWLRQPHNVSGSGYIVVIFWLDCIESSSLLMSNVTIINKHFILFFEYSKPLKIQQHDKKNKNTAWKLNNNYGKLLACWSVKL